MNLAQMYALIKRYLALAHRLRGNIRDDDYRTLMEVYTHLTERYNKLMMFADEDNFLNKRVMATRDMKASSFVPKTYKGDLGTIVGWSRDHKSVYRFLVQFDQDPHKYLIKRVDFQVVE